MRRPRRLRLESTDTFERELLSSWLRDGPTAAGKRRALAMVAVAVGSSAAGAPAAAAVTHAAAGVSGSLAPKAATWTAALAIKWVALGGVALTTTSAAVYYATAPILHAHSASAEPSTAAVAAIPRGAARIEAPGVLVSAAAASSPASSASSAGAASEPVRLAPKPAAPSPAAPSPAVVEEPKPPEAAGGSIGVELATLDEARGAIAAGDARRALQALDDHDRRYPRGALAQEATMLRVRALLVAGDRANAISIGRRLVDAHPSSPYAAEIRRLVGDDGAR